MNQTQLEIGGRTLKIETGHVAHDIDAAVEIEIAAVVIEPLVQAAADQRVTLTPHDAAMARAGDAAGRIEQYIESLRARGVM